MGIFGFFKPKWQHQDPDVRLQAVRELEDQDALAKVAAGDEDPEIREVAVRRLRDTEVLSIIATEDEHVDVRAAAADVIEDQELLSCVATSDPSPKVRATAVSHLAEPLVLRNIILNEKYFPVCEEALARLDNDNYMQEIAREHPDASIRAAAVRRLAKPDMIVQYALNRDEHLEVRLAAISMVHSPAALEQLEQDPEPRVREQAAEQRAEARKSALRYIRNDQQLAAIVSDDPVEGVKLAAIARMNDQEELNQIARDKEHSDAVRLAAVERMHDEKLLSHIAGEFYQSPLGFAAMKRVPDMWRGFQLIVDGWISELRAAVSDHNDGIKESAEEDIRAIGGEIVSRYGLHGMEYTFDSLKQSAAKQIVDFCWHNIGPWRVDEHGLK